MKKIYQKFIIMLSCIITVLIILCSKNPMSPEYHFDESLEYVGQIRSNLSTYIVLRQDSSLWSWGFNANGTLGNGTLKSCSFPVRIKNVSKSVFVDMCDGIGVAMDNKGDIWFWGYAMVSSDNLALLSPITKPIVVSSMLSVIQMDMYGYKVRLLKEDGTLWLVDLNEFATTFQHVDPGQLTDFSNISYMSGAFLIHNDGTFESMVPIEPEFGGINPECHINDISIIENVPFRRTIVLKDDGTVWAWGQNDIGQLGDSTFVNRTVPVRVGDLQDVVAVSAHYDFNLVLKGDGTVWFWGFTTEWDKKGRTIGTNWPVQVEGLENIRLIYAAADCIVMDTEGNYFTFSVEDFKVKSVRF
jgi:alpha-tubulin suppressor-like RCC1 family protein